MKKILSIFIIVLLTNGFSSCEKDDICDADTDTTPRLMIQFYDYTNPEVPKNVTKLKVIAEGQENGIVFNAAAIGDLKYITSGNEIAVPLNTTADSVKYSFILNYGDANPDLVFTDTLQFNYSRQTIYVSRACGYKIIFSLNDNPDLDNPYVLNDDPVATQGNWIQGISIEQYNLTTENETHLKIYF
ncbi:MAG TPA: DUF6452 family protein [Flavobacterium sp.]|nr:DUF6452 family protein [Flavobacterium sp.]